MPTEPTDEIDPAVIVRAAIETLVFAPIGLGAKLVDDAPEALRRVRQELRNARFIGRLTVEQGASRLRERPSVDEPDRRAEDADTTAGDSDGLAIEHYDEMPAIEIVGLLDSLTPAQRAVIADHETAHRRRRTVLGKIAQLAE